MKCKVIKLVSLIALILLPLNVLAEVEGEIITQSDITKEEELSVSIKLNQDGNDKIDIFKGIVDFDENLLTIDKESIKLQNGWADYVYNDETHALIVINKYGSTLNEEIIKFNLKLKDEARPTNTSIKLNDMTVSNEDKDITLDNASTTVAVNLSSSEVGNKSEEVFVPKTLESKPVRIYFTLVLIVLELIIAIILVLLYRITARRITNVGQKVALITTLCLIEIVSIFAFFDADATKGDLNGDKVINYFDVQALANHIINSEFLPNFTLERADMNKDGLITTADLSILLRKTYAKTEYTATLTEALMESNAYEKGSVVDLSFLANVTDDEVVEYVLIDGKKYKAEKSSKNPKEYFVKIPLSEESKEYKYNVTEVILANGRSAKVDYKTNLTILKDKPVLSGFATKEDLQNGKVSVALTIKDDDNAIVNSIYELVNSSGNVVRRGELSKGKNALEFSLDNAVAYKFNIKIDYNRGSNSGEYYGTIEDSYDLRIVTNYKFQMKNLNLVQNGVVTKNLEKDIPTALTFTSTNVSGYAPKKVNIQGREYPVKRLGGNKYSVDLPNTILNGSPITISKVILSNGKVITTKVTTKYNVLSRKPVISINNLSENVSNSLMNINLDIEDNDSTLDDITVNLYDERGNLISSQKSNGDHNLNLSTKDTSKYTVKVFASYHLLFGSNDFVYKDVLMYEESIDAIAKVYINSYTIDNIYPDKNSVVKLNYNITSNYNESVSQIVVNNVIYNVKKVGINSYEVEIPVGDIAGVSEYKTGKVILANGKDVNTSQSASLDVLKDYPVMDNLIIDENIEDSKINMTFDFFDNDGAFTSGVVRLTNKETNEVVQSENIILGKNSMEFVLENAVKYNIDVLIDGVLDTKTLNSLSPNTFTEYNIYSNEYRIIKDYKLEVTDITSYKENNVSDYFDINEQIKLNFKSSNVSEYTPVKVRIDGIYYDVSEINDEYTFTIDGFIEPGVKTLKIETLILSNMKEITVDCTKRIEILKSIPIVSEEETIVDENNVTLKLNIEDTHSVLSNLRAVVTDKDDREVFNNTITNEILFSKNGSDKYTIKVYGTYDLDSDELASDLNEFIDQELFTKVIE